MKIIDLHGVKHTNVEKIIVDACSKNSLPFIIITGRSQRMKDIVAATVALFDLETRSVIGNNGRVIVEEKASGR